MWVALLAVAEGTWCTSQAKCQGILEGNPNDAGAWRHLGFRGGGHVQGDDYTPQQCYKKALELNPKDQYAWYNLGTVGGGHVGGKHFTPKVCYEKALSLDPKYSLAWYNLGNHGGGHVGAKHFTLKVCYEKALALNPKDSAAWNNLGNHGGGNVGGKYYNPVECYQEALTLDPENPDAWWDLGNHGGGRVAGQKYSPEESYEKASRFYEKQLDAKLADLPTSVSSSDFRAVAVELLEGGSKGSFKADMKAAFEACHPKKSGQCLPEAQALRSYWPGHLARKLPEVPAEVTTLIVKGMVRKLTKPCGHKDFSHEVLTESVCGAQWDWELEHTRRLAAGRRLLGNPCASSMERLFEEFATEVAGRGRSCPCHLGAAKRTCTPLAHGMSGRPFIDRLDRHQPEFAALCHRPVRLEDRVAVGCKPCAGRR